MSQMIDNKIIAFLDPETIEEAAKQQLFNIARLPFIFRHVAVMPDCHLGKGATVGSVIATKGAVVPAAVGVDIGCGMIAVKTAASANHLPDNLKDLRDGIEKRVPSGFAVNQHMTVSARDRATMLNLKSMRDYDEVDPKWPKAIGSLGGGNHFIEICLDEDDYVWIVLHSGSRGIGNKIARFHMDAAKDCMKKWHIELADRDLAYLPEKTPEYIAYMRDLKWAQDFALANREEMMDRVLVEFFKSVPEIIRGIEMERINCHHNFTQMENHYGQNVLVTRKGAIQMRRGQRGVIPGSMGTKSYIVSGLENREAFHSAPHGAGRRFSRTEARRRFTMDDYKEAMKGIECRESKALLDEIPAAYKDIDVVMENSNELVEVKHVLKQVLNVKGD